MTRVLGYTTNDYILRSVDSVFAPLCLLPSLSIFAVGLHSVVGWLLNQGNGRTMVRICAFCALPTGLIFASLGVWTAFQGLPAVTHGLIPPLLLGAGTAVSAYAAWLLRPVAPHPLPSCERCGWLAAVPLLLLSVLWAFSYYAADLGLKRAAQLARTLEHRPSVTLFSERSLATRTPGVIETRLDRQDSAYRFRYSGLRLLVRSNDRYFLLSEGWDPATGAVRA